MTKRTLLLIASFLVTFVGVSQVITAKASDDYKGFNFLIQGRQGNSWTGPEYRQTTNTQNPWKAGVVSSTEGNGSYYDFWIEHTNGENVSTWRRIYTGPDYPYVYCAAYSSASQSNVRLAAEDAVYLNYNPGTVISGYWDEETW